MMLVNLLDFIQMVSYIDRSLEFYFLIFILGRSIVKTLGARDLVMALLADNEPGKFYICYIYIYRYIYFNYTNK